MRQEACAMCDSTSGMMLAADLTEGRLQIGRSSQILHLKMCITCGKIVELIKD